MAWIAFVYNWIDDRSDPNAANAFEDGQSFGALVGKPSTTGSDAFERGAASDYLIVGSVSGADIAGSDAQAVLSAETSALITALPAPDTQAIATAETGVLAGTVPTTDAQAIISSESVAFTSPVAASDAQAVISDESGTIVPLVAPLDSQAISSDEVGTTGFLIVATDDQAIATDEAPALNAPITATDTQAFGANEVGTVSIPASYETPNGAAAFDLGASIGYLVGTADTFGLAAFERTDAIPYLIVRPSLVVPVSDATVIASDEVGAFPLATFTDDFTDGVLNTNGRWNNLYTDSLVPMVESGGVVTITLPAGTTGNHYSGLYSTRSYRLTESSLTAEVLQTPTVTNAESYVSLWSATQANAAVYIGVRGTTLHARRIVSGVDALIASVTYNPTAHRWWRISETGGAITWATSPDNSPGSYVTLATDTSGVVQSTSMSVDIGAGTNGAVAAPQPFVVGGINAPSDAPAPSYLVNGADAFERGVAFAFLAGAPTTTADAFGPGDAYPFVVSGLPGPAATPIAGDDTAALASDEFGAVSRLQSGTDTQAVASSDTGTLAARVAALGSTYGAAFYGQSAYGDQSGDAQAIASAESGTFVVQQPAADLQVLATDETALVTFATTVADAQAIASAEAGLLVTPITGSDPQAIGSSETVALTAQIAGDDDPQAFATDETLDLRAPTILTGDDTQGLASDEDGQVSQILSLADAQTLASDEPLLHVVVPVSDDTGPTVQSDEIGVVTVLVAVVDQQAIRGSDALARMIAGQTFTVAHLARGALQDRPDRGAGGLVDRPVRVVTNLRDRPALVGGALTGRPDPVTGGIQARRDPTDGTLHERPPSVAGTMKER